jgi:ABC-type glycerol-3-phosphate transport system substrate-binding protein
MKKNSVKGAVLSISVLALSACSGTWEEDGISAKAPAAAPQPETSTAVAAAPKTPAQVQLFTEGTAARPAAVIQDIKVAVNKTTVFNADPTVEQVEARLRASAAELGGDAVINVVISDVKVRGFSWGGRTGTGTVVKYN